MAPELEPPWQDQQAGRDPGRLPVLRGSGALMRHEEAGTRSLCPSCGRVTATVGRGTCASCWQAKTAGGESAFRAGEPRTTPLFGSLDNMPDWLWVAVGLAVVAGLLEAATLVFW